MEDSKRTVRGDYLFDDVVIDLANFRLRKEGRVKSLTPRAFDVLIYLIEQRGRVVEKQELFERVWKETFVTDNALTRAIKEIRRGLNDDAGAPRYIETVPKRGYRFIGELKGVPSAGAEITEESGRVDGIHGFSPLSNKSDEARIQEPTEAADDPAALISYPQAPVTKSNNKSVWAKFKEQNVAVGLIFVVVVVLIIVGFYVSRNQRTKHSLAVLPLENGSGDVNKDFMSDGITESLIDSLSQLPQLKVIPRTTAFRYKGRQVDPQKVGQDLQVDAVLTGKVIEQGDDLIIQMELTNTADGSQIWGERYQRKLADIFSLQEAIAKETSERLRLKLTGVEEQRLTKRYTENTAAYELYLKGRYHLNKLTPPEVQTSVSYFQQAVDVDPSYAVAYVGLADAYRTLVLTDDLPAMQFFPKGKAAAQKAVELDDQLAEAHAGLGFAVLFYDWNFTAAEKEYRRALELNPNSAETHSSYAGLFALTGRFPEALAEIKRARELDPLDLRTNSLEGRFLILAGHTDEGLARLEKTIELEPNFFLAHLFASNAYIEKGMYGEAIAEATKARDLSGNVEAIATIGYALAMSGKRDEAHGVLDELQKQSSHRYIPPYDFALVYNGLDETNEAITWLGRGVEQRDPKMLFLKVGPGWANLRGNPRFQEVLRRVGLTTASANSHG
jgi:TolB-like protein/DNA-binding winged helix-turn-helix (wHTH) protein/Tfp pilus assembly protein PilF